MKFKFKLSDFLLLSATLIIIILSVFLWIFIMTNDQHFSKINQSDNISQQQVRNRTNSKQLFDLYIPTCSYGFVKGKVYRLYDSKNNLPFEFSKSLKKVKIDKLKYLSKKQATYEALLNNDNFIQLTYPDEITFGLFANDTSKNDNQEFNRIFIPASNKWIYLGNDQTNKLYRLQIRNGNFNRLRQYAKNAHSKIPVNFVRLKAGYSAFYDKNVNWRVYSYLVNYQSDSYFVSRLLGTSGVSSRSNKKGNQTTYALNYYTRLRVPESGLNNNHDYLYTHYEKEKMPNTTNRLLDSIFYVHRLGLTEQDLRFFDADNKSVSYANYIEGTPVFLNQHDVQIKNIFSTDAITVSFNSINFQIPVPTDGQTKQLESTEQVITNLAEHGLKQNEIQRITVGFTVEKDNSHHSLVNLMPTYYVKAHNEWKSIAEWEHQDMTMYKEAIDSESGSN